MKKVSVIVPCRNEEVFIKKVLENILVQDYPHELTEVFIVDGMSSDATRNVAMLAVSGNPRFRLIDNPYKVVPHALNLAIKESKGEIILRMDAHAEYPSDYISTLVNGLDEFNADNTGGVWITSPGDESLMAQAIASATSHPFGIGNAQYRLGGSKPSETDTVPFGCYRKEVFERIGLFDEDLIRNQDDEFNARLKKHGGRIILIPSLKIKYFARPTLRKISNMFYQYGLFKPLVNVKLGYPASVRQLAPPLLIMALSGMLVISFMSNFIFYAWLLLVFVYLFIDLLVSAVLVINKKKFALFFPLILVFPAIHFSYGCGYLHGVLKFVLLKEHKRKNSAAIPINR